MKKNVIIVILSLIILLLIIGLYSKYQYIKNYDNLVFSLEKFTYKYEISPLINNLSQLEEKIDYRKDDEYGLNKINNKHIIDLLNNSRLSYLSKNNTGEYIINYDKNIDSNSVFCVYIYSKNKFSLINDIGIQIPYPELYNEYGSKFSKNRLVKINNDYAKYCSYPYFN